MGTPLKVQFKRRETWFIAAGIGIGIVQAVLVSLLSLREEGAALQELGAVAAALTPLASIFLGTGAVTQIKRAHQRGLEIGQDLTKAASPYLNLDARTPITREGARAIMQPVSLAQPAPVVQPPPSPVVNPSSPVTLIPDPGTDPMEDATHVLPNAPTDDDRIGQ